jgi:cytochrome P450
MKLLTDHPDQRQIWWDDFPGVAKSAVEEIVRCASPVIHMRRTALADTRIGDQDIAAGDKVVMWYTSASRDEAVFEDADRFDIHRGSPDHKAFGGGGRHFCLGAGLARLELRVILEELLARAPALERAGAVERLPSSWANGLTKLPVTAR